MTYVYMHIVFLMTQGYHLTHSSTHICVFTSNKYLLNNKGITIETNMDKVHGRIFLLLYCHEAKQSLIFTQTNKIRHNMLYNMCISVCVYVYYMFIFH